MPIGCYLLASSFDILYTGPIDTLGNITEFFGSGSGTCSGDGFFDTGDAIIAADNFTDATNKCTALVGPTGSVLDLGGTVLIPNVTGFWLCIGPPPLPE